MEDKVLHIPGRETIYAQQMQPPLTPQQETQLKHDMINCIGLALLVILGLNVLIKLWSSAWRRGN